MGHKAFDLMSSLSSIVTDAALSVTSGSYDQTKTNLVNRIQSRSPNGTTLPGLGISPVNFLSTQDLTGTPNPVAHGYSIDPSGSSTVSRVFIPLTPSAASLPIAYFQYNYLTGVWTYIGKLTLTLNSSTVHTVRGIAVDDNSGGTTGWSIHVATTNATASNGGYFYAPNIDAADFTPGGSITIGTATTGDTQASKKVFWMQETGGTNLLTASLGFFFDAVAKVAYLGNATTNTIFYKFTYNTTISTVGASGITTDCYNFKTGTHTAFGTSLQTNALKLAVPKSSQNASLIGQKCGYMSSATIGYHFLLSDLSSGSTTVPSLVSWNKLGTAVDYASITWAQATWSNLLDVEINASTATGIFMMKRSINNDPNMRVFGKDDPIYSEVAGSKYPAAFAGTTIAGIFMSSGVLIANSTAVGQRGMYAIDIAADQYFVKTYTGVVAPSFLITPVITIDCAQALANAFVSEYRVGGTMPVLQYRTSSFGVFPGTWTDLPSNNNLASVGGLANVAQIQYRLLFSNMGDYGTNAQLVNEIILSYVNKYETSDSWLVKVDGTSRNGESPVTVAAKQIKAYGAVKTIYFNLYDSAGALVAQLNTSTHYAQFKKSTNGGSSYSNMASANDYTNSGAGTTVIQLNWAAPVAGVTRVAVRDVSY